MQMAGSYSEDSLGENQEVQETMIVIVSQGLRSSFF